MENKKSGVLIGLVIGLLIGIIAGLCIYIVMDKKEDNKNTSNDKKQTSETKKDEVKDETKNETKKDKVKDLSDQTFDLANFDESKIINKANDYIKYYKESIVESSKYTRNVQPEIMVSTNQDVKVRINWNDLLYLGGESKEFPYSINVGSDIKDVYVGGWGQAAGREHLFFLLKDGTIAYTPITSDIGRQLVNDDSIKSLKVEGKVPGVEDIVILATVQVGDTRSIVGSHATTIAIKADGSFYDLKEILDAE